MTSGPDWLEQAQRLFDALRAPGAPAPGAPADPSADPSAAEAHRSDCRWCPICQSAAVLRGERPEVTEALADILSTTATALRTFAETAQARSPGTPDAAEPDDVAADDAEAGAPPPVVQRIEIA
ncbi:MAG: uncharacterized protein JWR82_1475 [Blastococcus sp.]|jgi:hypothetical protein|nr:uncharacterized protein [Blastococcus sp.]